jgi:hypothetical protein
LSPATPVEELETNFGGQIILDGIDPNPIREGWTVCGEGRTLTWASVPE